MIKRISQPTGFFTGREKVVSAFYWPMRPEPLVKHAAKLSQERLPESLHSHPLREKGTKGEIH